MLKAYRGPFETPRPTGFGHFSSAIANTLKPPTTRPFRLWVTWMRALPLSSLTPSVKGRAPRRGTFTPATRAGAFSSSVEFSFVGRQKAEAIDLARVLQDLPPALHAWEEMGDLAERRLPRFDSELAIVVGGVPDLEGIFDDFPHHHRDRNDTEIALRDGIRLVPGCVPVQQDGSREPSDVLLVIYCRDQALVTAVFQGRRPGRRRWESNDPGRRQSPARDGDGDRRPAGRLRSWRH